jgi:hypothetical protein
MKSCTCTKCGETLTAPYFFKGQPYGWTCIKTVNPTAKKKNSKEHWIEANGHDYNPAEGKQLVTVRFTFNDKSYKRTMMVFPNNDGGHWGFDKVEIDGDKVYVNIYDLIQKIKLEENIKKGNTAC